MRNLRILAAAGLLCAASVANAEFSSTWTLISDYDFRGISQSATDPAIQPSIDFAMDNGWYIGAWASNVDFGDDTDYEVDFYTGFSGGEEDGLGWDVGLVYYTYYPDDADINYPEIYAALTYDWFEGKVWYSNDYVNSGESAFYTEANGTFPLAETNFSILAHIGYSFGDAWDLLADDTNAGILEETGVDPGFDGEYLDYSIGVGYTAGNFEFALKWVDTDGDIEVTDDVSNNEGRVIFSVETTFPWGEE
jgi:uncharacterized protein (TIGR02001 family)